MDSLRFAPHYTIGIEISKDLDDFRPSATDVGVRNDSYVLLLLIPIAFSLEKRGIFFKLTLLILGGLGFFINLVYLLQDTHWFVWGFMGDDSRGLYSLGRKDDGGVHPVWINPLVIWSLEYNQLPDKEYFSFTRYRFFVFAELRQVHVEEISESRGDRVGQKNTWKQL